MAWIEDPERGKLTFNRTSLGALQGLCPNEIEIPFRSVTSGSWGRFKPLPHLLKNRLNSRIFVRRSEK